MHRFIATALVLVAGTMVFAEDGSTTLKRDALEHRKSVKSIEAMITTKMNFPKLGEPQKWKSHVWIDGKYAREDRAFIEDSIAYREVKSITPTELIYWKSDRVLNVEGMAIHRWRAEALEEKRQNVLRVPRDPRLLGFTSNITNTLTVAVPLDSIFGNTEATSTTTEVKTRQVAGREMKEVLETFPNGASRRMRFDPQAGSSLVELELSIEAIRATVKTEYQKWGEDDVVWFPRRVVVEEHSDGKLKYHEETNVELISLNVPIPKSQFEIQSLKIPPKQFQTYPTASPSYWDGVKEQPGYCPASTP